MPTNAQQKNRQKEQVTRHAAVLFYITCGSAKTDFHSCTQIQAIARKGKLLVALKMPTNNTKENRQKRQVTPAMPVLPSKKANYLLL